MSEHDFWRALLPWYAAGTLLPEERDHVQQHIAECAACRQELAQWRVISQAVQSEVTEHAARLAQTSEYTGPSISPSLSLHASQKGSSSMNSSKPSSFPPNPLPSRQRASFSIAALLLTVLIVASVGWFGFAHQGNSNAARSISTTLTRPTPAATVPTTAIQATPTPIPQCTPTSSTSSVSIAPYFSSVPIPVHASVTVNSITFSVNAISMGANATYLFYTSHVAGTNSGGGIPDSDTLQDGKCRTVPWTGTSGGTASGGYSGVLNFGPLPKEDRTLPQTLTLSVNGLTGMGDTHGTWKVVFATPDALVHPIAYASQPITQNGITIAVKSADVIEAGKQPDGYPGALFVDMTISGIARNNACPIPFPGTPYPNIEDDGLVSSPIHLTLANGQTNNTPFFAIDPYNITLRGNDTTCVGNGTPYTDEFQLIFLGSVPDGIAQLSIPYLLLGYQSSYTKLNGPWTFQIPIN